jgi:hypothetical protein
MAASFTLFPAQFRVGSQVRQWKAHTPAPRKPAAARAVPAPCVLSAGSLRPTIPTTQDQPSPTERVQRNC